MKHFMIRYHFMISFKAYIVLKFKYINKYKRIIDKNISIIVLELFRIRSIISHKN